ncbi:MAG TPA: hypothetical protein VJZ00_11410, partial [Thermoanaerobaculia bacterium]|nr:hypothetical protein [Thermoanaerobaculia bacterium]
MKRVLLVAVLFSWCCARPPANTRELVPWAWERREDLRFVSGEVAYLAETIELRGGTTNVLRRRQPLLVTDPHRLTPVIRIETHRASLTDTQRHAAADAIAALGSQRVQIDFDATHSERTFYAALLRDLHRTIPHITITALASWCSDDRWLAGLPIDDAIPMLFQMGTDDRLIRARLARGEDLAEPRCRASAGISLMEIPPRLPPRQRIYVFNA